MLPVELHIFFFCSLMKSITSMPHVLIQNVYMRVNLAWERLHLEH